MDLQQLNDALVKALETLGLTEIEVTLKPKNAPGAHVKVFVSAETRPSSPDNPDAL